MTVQTSGVVALLLWLCVQLAWSTRLAKPGSTHPSFPMDAFAKPTFELVFEDSNPISNQTALDMLRNYSQRQVAKMSQASDTGMSEYQVESTDESNEEDKNPLQVYLHRTSSSKLHLCSIPRPQAKAQTTLHLNESTLKDHRNRIVERALYLLSPLKDTCLFYTVDWFTYSLCYGDAIKQFRALPHTIGGPTAPAMDPTQDSFVLGRWNDQIEGLKDSETSTDLQTSQADTPKRGTELMELVHFSSLGDSNSDYDRQEEDSKRSIEANVEGKGRYISQVWTDGTRCDINNEFRTTEVQFHCSKTPAKDRISIIKEVTTCSYVVVVDTPRLCEEPALDQAEDEVRRIKCQPILSDEEMSKRQSAAADAIAERDAEPSMSTVKQKVSDEAKSATKRDREGLKASIESIVNQINKAGDPATELGVIIGWDEDGKFMIAKTPKDQEAEVNKVDRAASTEETEAASKIKEKWDGLLQKLQELETEIVDAADVELYLANIQETGEVVLDSKIELKAEDLPPAKQQQEQEKQEKTPLDKPATETQAGENIPLQTNHNQLTREKESLGQRVERHYKEQEAQRQREEEAKKVDARNRDEL